jgi:pyrimidine/purine-5'-nucleotide nucleosidase
VCFGEPTQQNNEQPMKLISRATVRPTSSLNLLSRREIEGVMSSDDDVFQVFRECALAVLNTGNEEDDAAELLAHHKDFDIRIISESRGIKLEVSNAPASAFVDGKMIRGIQDHLFSALRDIVYTHHKISLGDGRFDLESDVGITDSVFRILRNAGVVKPNVKPKLVVCWGGHSIERDEYDYTKHVGYQLGLRDLNIATGCGIGAMKGPMKGAAVGHGKQQIDDGRYVGITEPGIIASESPNPTVSELVILPDIEKRLEAFVRLSHCIIVFPGGAGTAEEVLYLLGLLMHPKNQGIPVPLIFAAPEGSGEYFTALDLFIRNTLGDEATQYYQVVIGQEDKVAQMAKAGVERVQRYRRKHHESYVYNWRMYVPSELQQPFVPSHENMLNLNLDASLPSYALAGELRRAFSGIVAGNVKAEGINRVKEHGPYIIRGEKRLVTEMDELLRGFVAQGRMKLKGKYSPCYQLTP